MRTSLIESLQRTTTKRPAAHENAQRLLDWIQTRKSDRLRLADILVYGPWQLRKRKIAIEAADVLVRHGWLEDRPYEVRQYNSRKWRIIRRLVAQPHI